MEPTENVNMEKKETAQDGNSGAGASSEVTMTSMISTVKEMAKTDESPATVTSEDNNLLVPFTLSAEELGKLLEQVREKASENPDDEVVSFHDFYLAAALHARKGDVARSLALAKNLLIWYKKMGYDQVSKRVSDEVKAALRAGMLVIPETFSKRGQPIVILRYSSFDPKKYSAETMAIAIALVIDYIQRVYPAALSHGIAVFEDVNKFSLKNIDLKMFWYMESAFTRTLPVRLAGVHVTSPPAFIRAIFNLFKRVLSNKFKTRIRMYERGAGEKLEEFFELSSIPTFMEMNGTLELDENTQKETVERVILEAEKWEITK